MNWNFCARLMVVQSIFLPILDWWCIICIVPFLSSFFKLDVVYHAALHFVTEAKARTHYCKLYEMVKWTSLSLWRKSHVLIFIAKALVVKLPPYICSLLTRHTSAYSSRSVNIPAMRTELGKTSFCSFAPYAWDDFQKMIDLNSLPSDVFKNLLKTTLIEQCHCS